MKRARFISLARFDLLGSIFFEQRLSPVRPQPQPPPFRRNPNRFVPLPVARAGAWRRTQARSLQVFIQV